MKIEIESLTIANLEKAVDAFALETWQVQFEHFWYEVAVVIALTIAQNYWSVVARVDGREADELFRLVAPNMLVVANG